MTNVTIERAIATPETYYVKINGVTIATLSDGSEAVAIAIFIRDNARAIADAVNGDKSIALRGVKYGCIGMGGKPCGEKWTSPEGLSWDECSRAARLAGWEVVSNTGVWLCPKHAKNATMTTPRVAATTTKETQQ